MGTMFVLVAVICFALGYVCCMFDCARKLNQHIQEMEKEMNKNVHF